MYHENWLILKTSQFRRRKNLNEFQSPRPSHLKIIIICLEKKSTKKELMVKRTHIRKNMKEFPSKVGKIRFDFLGKFALRHDVRKV